MAGFLAVPQYQFMDDAGEVLAGGKVYTYAVGSTTPKASYPTLADAIAGTSAHTNPIILDSAGRAAIVLAGPTKLVVKDSSDNVLWTQDNVTSDGTVLDSNGKKLLEYTTTSSAVNYLKVKNAATAGAVIIDTDGTDSLPQLTLQAKGGTANVNVTKLVATSATLNSPTIDSATITNTTYAPTTPLIVAGTAGAAAEVRLSEKTGNGTNYVGFKAADSLSANKVWVLPSADGSANTFMKTDGAGTLAFSTLTAVAATQSDQETATSSVVPVVPSVQQYHPSAAKFWISYTNYAAINASYNVTSITDNGTGDTTITIATDFSSGNYAVAGMILDGTNRTLVAQAQAAGTLRTYSYAAATGTLIDVLASEVIGFGDQ